YPPTPVPPTLGALVLFRAPRFEAAGKKTANARATVVLNGQKLFDEQELDLPTGAAGRLGEAAAALLPSVLGDADGRVRAEGIGAAVAIGSAALPALEAALPSLSGGQRNAVERAIAEIRERGGARPAA
ncbi:MAG: hypothetical protein WCH13_17455, partial [Deltaproteobacteria bacterium]